MKVERVKVGRVMVGRVVMGRGRVKVVRGWGGAVWSPEWFGIKGRGEAKSEMLGGSEIPTAPTTSSCFSALAPSSLYLLPPLTTFCNHSSAT